MGVGKCVCIFTLLGCAAVTSSVQVLKQVHAAAAFPRLGLLSICICSLSCLKTVAGLTHLPT